MRERTLSALTDRLVDEREAHRCFLERVDRERDQQYENERIRAHKAAVRTIGWWTLYAVLLGCALISALNTPARPGEAFDGVAPVVNEVARPCHETITTYGDLECR